MAGVDEILELVRKVRKAGAGWTGLCPAHSDQHPSLSIGVGADGRVLLHCFAGCTPKRIVAALGLELSDLFAEGEGGGSTARNQRPVVQLVRVDGELADTAGGLTVEQLAAAKQLPVELLAELGCETVRHFGPPAVQVPYHDEYGEIVGTRYRLGRGGQFRWKKGTKASALLYGVDRLPAIREAGFVLLVEGESDAWTLLHHGFPVVALPGAGMWNDADAARLDGVDTIYVVVEPDQGGDTLVRMLRDSEIRPRVRLLRLPTKDVSELHLLDEGSFAARLREALDDATPLLDYEEEQRQAEGAALWERCRVLALEPDILALFTEELRARGFAGPTRTSKLIFLVLTSRLLPRPVSIVARGLSSAGKSYTVEAVLWFFPESAYFDRSGMSERALVYSEEDFRHRILYIAEAEGVAEGLGAYFLRTLISENKLVYETVEKDGERLVSRVIEKPGPTGVILTTTRLRLHPENETRMLALTVSDDPRLTRQIMRSIAQRDDAAAEDGPPEAWPTLQRWLEIVGERRVTDQDHFLLVLAEIIPTVAVRLRRDFALIRSLIFAHALLHQAGRPRDRTGRVVATLDDYAAVRELVADVLAEGIGATVSDDVRQTVAAVEAALERTPDNVVRRAHVQVELGLDDRAARRRLAQAVEAGFVENTNPGRGKPGLYKLGQPIPDNVEILPSADNLRRHLDNRDNPAAAPGDTPPPPLPAMDSLARVDRSDSADRDALALAAELVATFDALEHDTVQVGQPDVEWECPCGQEPPKRHNGPTPRRTAVSLREPSCPFCRRAYKHEYRVTNTDAAGERPERARP